MKAACVFALYVLTASGIRILLDSTATPEKKTLEA